ncbi:SLATT domain-containing protein [Helicobacter sp. L8]|uniref:SLATT domain-containing protein n=1 Tax=Helicobacter sp. L8 TaxID=2316078 RepID=UPI0013CE00A0|nr:SLATT domain-containing protein [Helicobacter sp. L8]
MQEIKESYGRVTHSKTAFNRELKIRERDYKCFRWGQVTLSVLTFVCSSISIGFSHWSLPWLGVFLSMPLLALNLYVKETDIVKEIESYRQGADELWFICDRYIALMTDFQVLSDVEIRDKKEKLDKKLGEIYKKYPKTNRKAYEQARQALKSEEEQFFSEEELNKILPRHLRSRCWCGCKNSCTVKEDSSA